MHTIEGSSTEGGYRQGTDDLFVLFAFGNNHSEHSLLMRICNGIRYSDEFGKEILCSTHMGPRVTRESSEISNLRRVTSRTVHFMTVLPS